MKLSVGCSCDSGGEHRKRSILLHDTDVNVTCCGLVDFGSQQSYIVLDPLLIMFSLYIPAYLPGICRVRPEADGRERARRHAMDNIPSLSIKK